MPAGPFAPHYSLLHTLNASSSSSQALSPNSQEAAVSLKKKPILGPA